MLQHSPHHYPIISADSHVTEPPSAYRDYIDPRFRERAPRIEKVDGKDCYIIEGCDIKIWMRLMSGAGMKPEEMEEVDVPFEELHRGGWDPAARLGEQDQDGVSAEVIYPTVGMVLLNLEDIEYKAACFNAYNQWMSDYCRYAPRRLLGAGQAVVRTPREGIDELERIKDLGLSTVMLPARPVTEDYDSPIYDDFWRKAVELDMPISFHVLTGKVDLRGPKMNNFSQIIRLNQDVIGTMIFGGSFERVPDLKVVCVEADAGWAPHYMYRMDHAFKRHPRWIPKGMHFSKRPSEYFRDNIYLTFQDDATAFQWAALDGEFALNWRKLMWANDFPHADSTWPWSQDVIRDQASHLPEDRKRAILSDNVAELYGIDIEELAAA